MDKRDVKIGTTYRIRELDDLVAEFGLVDVATHCTINTPCIIRMDWAEKICGMPFTPKKRVVEFYYSPYRGGHVEVCYESEEGVEYPFADHAMRVAVTAEILEPLDEEPPLELSVNDLLDLLMT